MFVINIDCNPHVENAFKNLIKALSYTVDNEMNHTAVFICKCGEDIKKRGYHIPDVFIFQQESDGKTFYHDFFWDADAVKKRLESFKKFPEIQPDDLKDWCIGALRMHLGLDEYCHGVTSCDPRKNPDALIENAEKITDKLLTKMFEEELEELKKLKGMEKLKEKVGDFIKKIEPQGSQVRFLKPFGKLNVLLIDDEKPADDTKVWSNLNITELIFSENTNKINHLLNKLKGLSLSRYQFDIILLDLCIQDNLNDDPTGYSFLPVLRQFFPLTPIVVYSSFTDMGHISRAFREGATWYLRKENKHKLARHLVSIFSCPQWQREWNAQKNTYEFSPGEMDDIDKFLIANLTRNLPGKTIKWLKTTDGASSSKTYIIDKDYSRAVVKIDAPEQTKSEYDRYQRFIRPYLDNNAGRIYTPPVIADYQKSAIAYTFAGGASCDIETFRQCIQRALCGEESIEKIKSCIYDLYQNLVSQLHNVTIQEQDEHRDYPNLYYYETNSPTGSYAMKMPNENSYRVDEINNNYLGAPESTFISRGITRGKNSVHFFDINNLTPYKITGDLIRTAGMHELNSFVFNLSGEKFPDPDTQQQEQLREIFDKENEKIGIRIVHGDLNTGNIMLEKNTTRIWLIDFAVTHRDSPIIDYTVLYYSVLRDLRNILNVKPKESNFKQLILSSLQLESERPLLLNSSSTLELCKWKNAYSILTHITQNVPQNWLRAYQCGIAMSLIYGTRNLIDKNNRQKDWTEIAKAAAAAITKSLLAKSEA